MNRPERIFKDILFTIERLKNLGSILENTPKESKHNVEVQLDELEAELEEERDVLSSFEIDEDKRVTIRRTVNEQLQRYKQYLSQCLIDYDGTHQAPSQTNELSKKLCNDILSAILVDSRGANNAEEFKWSEIRCDDGDSGKFIVFVDEEIANFQNIFFDSYNGLLDYYTEFQDRICGKF